MDIPFLDDANNERLVDQALGLQARLRIAKRQWDFLSPQDDAHTWTTRINQSNDEDYQLWAWISLTWNAPGWQKLTTAKIQKWAPVWTKFVDKPQAWWDQAYKLECGRMETRWTYQLKEALHAQSAQPLWDWWKGLRDHNPDILDDTFFWRASTATLKNHDTIVQSMNTLWLQELSHPNLDNLYALFEWSNLCFHSIPAAPKEFTQWLEHLHAHHPEHVRTLSFHVLLNSPWKDDVALAVIRGVCAQEGLNAAHPTNVQTIWSQISLCHYMTRLSIAQAFMNMTDIEHASSRFPVDYREMTSTILRAYPNTDLNRWGTTPWLAGLLHILPEFTTVLTFHDLLPIVPNMAHDLVDFYIDHYREEQSPDLRPIESDLFEVPNV